jgi:hypothetical protein
LPGRVDVVVEPVGTVVVGPVPPGVEVDEPVDAGEVVVTVVAGPDVDDEPLDVVRDVPPCEVADPFVALVEHAARTTVAISTVATTTRRLPRVERGVRS